MQANAAMPRDGVRIGEAVRIALGSDRKLMNGLVGFVICMIPIVGPMVLMGWASEICQRVVRRDAEAVPPLRFADFTFWLKRGLHPFIAQMVANSVGSLVGGVFYVPFMFVFMASSAVGLSESMMIWTVVGMVALVTVITLLMTPLFNAVQTRAEISENISVALDPRAIWDMTKRTFLLTLFAYFVGGLVFGLGFLVFGVLTLGFGFIVAIPLSVSFFAVLQAQIYESHVARGGEPVPMPARQPLPSESPALLV